MRSVAGVPLLARVVLTAVRAGADSILVMWPKDVDADVLKSDTTLAHLKGISVQHLARTQAFDPENHVDWTQIASKLEDRFLWLPWNWVTYKRALTGLTPSRLFPASWLRPLLLERNAVLPGAPFLVIGSNDTPGITITFPETVRRAERFLVANSGKATDGLYSNFNRWLCRPFVWLIAHTPLTPNALTLTGLLVALIGALYFAQDTYSGSVVGALLFFVSGLFDEMDGMIARIKFKESAFGTWFEGFVDNITYLAIFAGIVIGKYRLEGSWALKCGAALIVGSLLSVAAIAWQRKLATAPDRPHEYAGRMNTLLETDSSNPLSFFARHLNVFVRKGVVIHYLLLFAVFGGLRVFLWLAALGSNVTWILTLYFTWRFFGRRSHEVVESAPLESNLGTKS
jgi:phosphatidylglycerophosphate synthase